MSAPPPVEVVVDARDTRCPMPVILLARAAQEHPPGTVVLVLATDPAARADIPAWCRMRAQALLDVTDEDTHSAYRVGLR